MATVALIVDDHPMCRRAAAMAFQAVDPAIEILEGSCLADARALAGRADIITMDLALPDSRGVLGLSEFRAEFSHVPMLVISGNANPAVEREVAVLNAHGFLSKEAAMQDMVAAIRAVLDGRDWFSVGIDEAAAGPTDLERIRQLTAAQMRVLQALSDGSLNKQIAYDLDLSEITVKAHVKAILRKLGVPNRTQAVLMLARVER